MDEQTTTPTAPRGSTPTEELSPSHLTKLAGQFATWLQKPIGFRDATRAGMLLVYMYKDSVSQAHRDQLADRIKTAVIGLDDRTQRNFAHGLCEVRLYIEEREPGLRTMGAMSLWEEVVGSSLPLSLQYLAREGEIT